MKGDIIYVAISGFGTRSIKPERAAFDIIAQATSGQFWKKDDDLKPPTNHWADFMTGAYAAMGAMLGLVHKINTGEGQFVDVSMQDVLYFNNYRATVQKAMGPIMGDVEKALGRRPEDVLNTSDRMPFYGFFKAKDGKVAIVAMTPRQWKYLTQIIGRPEMASDPRFENLLVQIHNHEAAVEFVDQWTSRHTSKEIIAVLEEKKIPCGIASGLDEVNEDENLKARGMFEKVHHPKFGDVDVPGVPYQFSRTPGAVRNAAPDLGEHNELILKKWLGCSADEIQVLRTEGAIVGR
jgi:crotonobetainyl-CoA:carnitine CoA-transferase CaiB-like acyl-CoA transferase